MSQPSIASLNSVSGSTDFRIPPFDRVAFTYNGSNLVETITYKYGTTTVATLTYTYSGTLVTAIVMTVP